jgi:predicted acetyltransferase/8-oxo-dGTP pyrophosphatase MutT (NUDIX family)
VDSMAHVILRELNQNDGDAFLRGYDDWKNEDLALYSFVWKPGMSHGEHLKLLEDHKDESKLPKHLVPSTMLYGFVGNEIVGRFNIRHRLNAYLFERGGHIGYSVSPAQRKNGYASQMFQQGLNYCKKLGMRKLLITCADQNVPSWKIIEKFGGSLENRILDTAKNELVRRYWLDFDGPQYDPMKVSEKAVAYITRIKDSKVQLLVFDHDERLKDAGTQVPSGTVDLGEDPHQTLVREIEEESGLEGLKVVGKIDQYQFYGEHAKKFLRRHVFHVEANGSEAEKWTHMVLGDGNDKGLHFHYFWIDIKDAKGRLSGRFDDSIDLLIRNLGL